MHAIIGFHMIHTAIMCDMDEPVLKSIICPLRTSDLRYFYMYNSTSLPWHYYVRWPST